MVKHRDYVQNVLTANPLWNELFSYLNTYGSNSGPNIILLFKKENKNAKRSKMDLPFDFLLHEILTVPFDVVPLGPSSKCLSVSIKFWFHVT